MGEPSLFDKMISHLRATSKYYTGYPKDLGPSGVIHFTSERKFVQLLHEGHPVVVAFTLRCNLTKHLDGVLEEAAAEFYPRKIYARRMPKISWFLYNTAEEGISIYRNISVQNNIQTSLGGTQSDHGSIMAFNFSL